MKLVIKIGFLYYLCAVTTAQPSLESCPLECVHGRAPRRGGWRTVGEQLAFPEAVIELCYK